MSTLHTQIQDHYQRVADNKKLHLDFRLPGNIKQNWDGVAEQFGALAAKKWSHADGFHNDAQIGQVSKCALTHLMRGFYLKKPRKTLWASGELITLTDREVHPGDRFIEYATAGARYDPVDDGITSPSSPPERAVGVAEDLTTQKFVPVKDFIEVTMQEIEEANKRGFDAIERKGRLLRQMHAQNINNIIRRGNKKFKVTGIVNSLNVKHRSATVDWGSASADVIWDDYRAALRNIFTAETEEDMPGICLLPQIQHHHVMTEQFSDASDSTLMTYIEANTPDHEILVDPGMRAADSLNGPAALYYTNDPDLVVVHMPYYMRMLPPHDHDAETIQIHVRSRIAGVQVIDEDTILVVEGTPAGWQKFV